ncbi:flagellar hook-basal body protein FliE [Planctomycetes bacterium CA13]|uniref:Flagellar hook-basal body complex protein FliE n=1 Tax=Novipirellula herctigrandis TaxID=2527986 RepID=A0A5C5Z873_9BACT|nr:flagellar hook-basal body protein FliE [Planctomycetes bacterium CA13]
MKSISTSFGPPLKPINPFAKASAGQGAKTGADTFVNLLGGQVDKVNAMQTDANEMVHSLLTGGDVNEAEVLTSVQKADLAFRMLLQVRNKLLEAYREVQQIQI